MTKNSETSTLLETAKRRAFVLQYRRGGATYQQIARKAIIEFGLDALPKGWDERYAWKDVKRELDRLRKDMAEDTEEIRQMELERLLELQRSLWGKAQKGDERAVDRVLKIMKRRSSLLGLDAPQKTELTGKDGEPIRIEDEEQNRAISTLAETVGEILSGTGKRGDGDMDTAE